MYEEEPLHWFVRDSKSSYAHHLDYARSLPDHALCGHAFGEVALEGEDRPKRLCRKCQERMPAHAAAWWEAQARRDKRLIASLRNSGAKAQRAVDEAIRRLELQGRTIKSLQGKLSTRQEEVNALNQTVAELRATYEEVQLQLRHEQEVSLAAQVKAENERIRRLEIGKAIGDRKSANGPEHEPRSRRPVRSAAKAPRVKPGRNKAKNKFYPVEVAPFPATFVSGGLPGHGKRR